MIELCGTRWGLLLHVTGIGIGHRSKLRSEGRREVSVGWLARCLGGLLGGELQWRGGMPELEGGLLWLLLGEIWRGRHRLVGGLSTMGEGGGGGG